MLSMCCFRVSRAEQASRQPSIKMPQQKDIVKIAIQMPGAYPQLIQLDQVRTSGMFRLTVSDWLMHTPAAETWSTKMHLRCRRMFYMCRICLLLVWNVPDCSRLQVCTVRLASPSWNGEVMLQHQSAVSLIALCVCVLFIWGLNRQQVSKYN